MKRKIMKALMNWRYYALAVVGTIAVFGIFAEPTDDNPYWFTAMFLSKAIGFGAGYLYARMIDFFNKKNEIPELMEFINFDEEV